MVTDLTYELEILQEARNKLLSVLHASSNDQLTAIKKGYNNNILWNIGHIVCTQQLLCYRVFGHEINLDPEFIDSFRKGSVPNGEKELKHIPAIERELQYGVDELKQNLTSLSWNMETPYATSFGITLNSIEEVVQFLLMHDGIHLGYIMAQKRIK